MCTNIRLVAAILVDIFNNEFYAEPVNDSINGFADNSRLNSDFGLMSSKLGFNTAPILPL